MFLSEISALPRELSVWKRGFTVFPLPSSKWYVSSKYVWDEWMVWSPFLFIGVFIVGYDLGVTKLLKILITEKF